MRRKLFLATAFVAVAATAGAGIVFAAGAVTKRGNPTIASTTGGGTGAGCGTAWQTRTGEFVPDEVIDDDWDVLTPASSVTFVKKCTGGAIATFSSETIEPGSIESQGPSVANHQDDIEIVLRATCTHTAGSFPTCHPGDRVYGNPGGEDDPVFFDNDPEDYGVRSMQWAFTSLAPGTWRVDVLAGADDNDEDGALEFRTLFVETL